MHYQTFISQNHIKHSKVNSQEGRIFRFAQRKERVKRSLSFPSSLGIAFQNYKTFQLYAHLMNLDIHK